MSAGDLRVLYNLAETENNDELIQLLLEKVVFPDVKAGRWSYDGWSLLSDVRSGQHLKDVDSKTVRDADRALNLVSMRLDNAMKKAFLIRDEYNPEVLKNGLNADESAMRSVKEAARQKFRGIDDRYGLDDNTVDRAREVAETVEPHILLEESP